MSSLELFSQLLWAAVEEKGDILAGFGGELSAILCLAGQKIACAAIFAYLQHSSQMETQKRYGGIGLLHGRTKVKKSAHINAKQCKFQ